MRAQAVPPVQAATRVAGVEAVPWIRAVPGVPLVAGDRAAAGARADTRVPVATAIAGGPRHRRRSRRRLVVVAGIVGGAAVAAAGFVTGGAAAMGGRREHADVARNAATLARPATRPPTPSPRIRPGVRPRNRPVATATGSAGARMSGYGDSPSAIAPSTAVTPPADGVDDGDVVSGVTARAEAELGVPYSWGGGTPGGPSAGIAQGAGVVGFDCSSLVRYAWWPWVHLPRTADDQAAAGVRVTRDRLRPGDLVSTDAFGHIMLYLGGGQVIEAMHTGTVISIRPLPAAGTVDTYVHIAPAVG
jgi:cell wall-associated NlpC family hydrolase